MKTPAAGVKTPLSADLCTPLAHTVETDLPDVLDDYKARGLTIVPVSQLLLTGETAIDAQGKQHKK